MILSSENHAIILFRVLMVHFRIIQVMRRMNCKLEFLEFTLGFLPKLAIRNSQNSAYFHRFNFTEFKIISLILFILLVKIILIKSQSMFVTGHFLIRNVFNSIYQMIIQRKHYHSFDEILNLVLMIIEDEFRFSSRMALRNNPL